MFFWVTNLYYNLSTPKNKIDDADYTTLYLYNILFIIYLIIYFGPCPMVEYIFLNEVLKRATLRVTN